MKFQIEAHVKKWDAPQKVYFDEGLKLPLNAVPDAAIRHLVIGWLDDVCAQAGMSYKIEFTPETKEGEA